MRRAAGFGYAWLAVMIGAAAPPAAAQVVDAPILLHLESIEVDSAPLNAGRLPVEIPLEIDFHYFLSIPPGGVCPSGVVRIDYRPYSNSYHDGFLVVSMTSQSFTLGPAVAASPTTYGPFHTTLVVTLDRTFRAFKDLETGVEAWAAVETATYPACNLRASDTVSGSVNVQSDYWLALEAVGDAWNGLDPEPLAVLNHGNGATRVRAELGTLRGPWLAAGPTLEIDRADSKGQPSSATFGFHRAEVPEDWNRTIRITGESVLQAEGLSPQQILVKVGHLGDSDPYAERSSPTGARTPGFGFVGALAAAAACLRRRTA